MGLFICMFFEKYFILIFFLGINVRWSLVIYFECCGYVYFEKKKLKGYVLDYYMILKKIRKVIK